MLSKKILLSVILLLAFINPCQAADKENNDKAKNKETKNALTFEISAPEAMPNLQPNEKPNPVFLQITANDGSAPVYSAPVFPGTLKPIELKMVSASSSGAQIQFVASFNNVIKPMSFVYAFTGERLNCLINKNAKIQIVYTISTQLLDVQGIPTGC